MSGHSKWKNIMHKKEKTDAQRAKVFTKIGKEMAIAIKEGGPDPVSNSKLRDPIQKAKAYNVPNDNIERVIKKFSGNNDVVYEEVTYEGYGPSGVAVIVRAATDNRNRTGGNVRHYFDKFGGNLGQNGCVSYLFEDKGFEITTEVSDLSSIREDLENRGYKIESAELDKIPSNYVTLEDDDSIKHMNLLLEYLEEDEDVQDVFHNWENVQ